MLLEKLAATAKTVAAAAAAVDTAGPEQTHTAAAGDTQTHSWHEQHHSAAILP